MLFLSHSGADAPAARDLAVRLREVGLEVWLDVEQLQPGDLWMARLEDALRQARAFAVYVGPSGIQRWVDREVRVALERSVADPEFRIIPILGRGAAGPEVLPSFIGQHHVLDLRDEARPDELKRLIGALLARPAETVSLLPPGTAPFRGLEYFDVEHAHLYFGRDQESEDLLAKLYLDRFVAVVGASGSGKSSLVRAGLIPALHRGRFQAGGGPTCWSVAIFRPGAHPFRALARALPDLAPGLPADERIRTIRECHRQLQDGAEGLTACIAGVVPRGHRVLLVVDQFEELFTQTASAERPDRQPRLQAERRAFVDAILRVTDDTGEKPVHVLITLRADFYSRCWEHPELPRRIAHNQHAARPLGRAQLTEILEKPLRLAGASFEQGLVDRILEDAGNEPGSLPLVEHALLLLWERRDGNVLTHHAYNEIGRVSGALAHHADQVFGRLQDDHEREMARKIFLRLTQPGEGTEDTRRRAGRDEIGALGSSDAVADRVLERLAAADARLVVTQREGDNDVVEVAHEALIREWPRLREWLDANRAAIRIERRLIEATADWERLDREPQALLRGMQLVETEEWACQNQNREDLRPQEQEFLEASLRARDQRAIEAKQRRKRTVRQLQATAAVLGAAFLVAAGMTVYAFRANNRAEANFELARQAVDESLSAVDRDPHHEALAGVADPEMATLRSDLLSRAQVFYAGFIEQRPDNRQVRERVASAHFNLARTHRSLDRSADAMREYLEAIERFGQLVQEHPSHEPYRQQLANTYNWLGETRRQSGHGATEVGAAYDSALTLQLALHRSDPENTEYRRDLARSFSNRGILHWAQIDIDPAAFARAESDFREAIALLEPFAAAATHPRAAQELGRAYNNLGTLHSSPGIERWDEAGSWYERAIATHRELAQHDPSNRGYRLELVKFYLNATAVLGERVQHDQAERHGRDALALIEELARPSTSLLIDRADAHTLLGLIGESRGLAAAIREYQRSLQVFRQIQQDTQVWDLPEFHQRYSDLLRNLAILATENHDAEPLRPVLTQATDAYLTLASQIADAGMTAAARRLLEYFADLEPLFPYVNGGQDPQTVRRRLEATAGRSTTTVSAMGSK